MMDLYSLVPRTAASSSSLGRETVLIEASLFFTITKEQCGLFFKNWNLIQEFNSTSPYAFSEALQKTCSSISEAL